MKTATKKKQAKKTDARQTIIRRKPRKPAATSKEEALNFDKVWKMFQENAEQMSESDKQMREQMRESDKKMRESDKKMREQMSESDKKMREQMSESDKKLREQMSETDKKIKELAGLFTTQWGKLVEALLGKGCLAIFKQRGIKITQSSSNVISTQGGNRMEIDVLLVNGDEAVVIEVKTTAKVEHVTELLEDLKEFKQFFPQYKSYKIYGALAALKFDAQSDIHAASQGLFVVEPSGEGLVNIKNTSNFIPKGF